MNFKFTLQNYREMFELYLSRIPRNRQVALHTIFHSVLTHMSYALFIELTVCKLFQTSVICICEGISPSVTYVDRQN